LTITNKGNIVADAGALVNIGLSADGKFETVSLRSLHQKLKIKPDGVAKLRLKFSIAKSQSAGDYFAFVSIVRNGAQATALSASPFTIV